MTQVNKRKGQTYPPSYSNYGHLKVVRIHNNMTPPNTTRSILLLRGTAPPFQKRGPGYHAWLYIHCIRCEGNNTEIGLD